MFTAPTCFAESGPFSCGSCTPSLGIFLRAETSDSEAAFYGVLGILAKPVFGCLLLWGHRNIDPAILGLHIRDYEDNVGTTRREKPITSTRAANNGIVTDTPATTV
jgi:hypothetical protein